MTSEIELKRKELEKNIRCCGKELNEDFFCGQDIFVCKECGYKIHGQRERLTGFNLGVEMGKAEEKKEILEWLDTRIRRNFHFQFDRSIIGEDKNKIIDFIIKELKQSIEGEKHD